VLLIECSFLVFVHVLINVFIVSQNLLRLQIDGIKAVKTQPCYRYWPIVAFVSFIGVQLTTCFNPFIWAIFRSTIACIMSRVNCNL
jgi:hypothetical protein